MHTHKHTSTQTYVYTQVHTPNKHMHTHKHTYNYTNIYKNKYLHTHTVTHAWTNPHTLIYAEALKKRTANFSFSFFINFYLSTFNIFFKNNYKIRTHKAICLFPPSFHFLKFQFNSSEKNILSSFLAKHICILVIIKF